MENWKNNALDRVLKEQDFKDVKEAIKSGEENEDLKHLELVKKLIKEYKGKTIQAPFEVIVTSAILLNIDEVIGTIEALKTIVQIKLADLKDKIDRGEVAVEDAMIALMVSLDI